MSSKEQERAHAEKLQQLMLEALMICSRSTPSTEEIEPEVEEEVKEEAGSVEEEPEVQTELVNEQYEYDEEMVEEEVHVFPSPSLRRVIPEKLRRLEAMDRIPVLPEVFKKDINSNQIPRIRYTPRKVYIDKLATMTGCKSYRTSLAEFWFLDTLANLLLRAQEDKMPRSSQSVLILWFCEWIKEMQYFDSANRTRMVKRWMDNMMNSAKVIADKQFLPTPDEAGVFYLPPVEDKSSNKVKTDETSKDISSSYECCFVDLSKILHYIFDLFCTDYQYDLIRSIFTFSPGYQQINGPFQIETPRQLYVVPKPPKEQKAKKEKKETKKKGKEVPDTEEYLHLQQVIEFAEKEIFEQQYLDTIEYTRRTSILPLIMAATDDLFDLYFPPPSDEELTTVVVDSPSTPKGKKGKK